MSQQKEIRKCHEYNVSGREAYKIKQYDLAITEFSCVINEHDIPKTNPQYIYALYERGRAYEKNSQLDLAMKDYHKVLSIQPDHTKAREKVDAYTLPTKLELYAEGDILAPETFSFSQQDISGHNTTFSSLSQSTGDISQLRTEQSAGFNTIGLINTFIRAMKTLFDPSSYESFNVQAIYSITKDTIEILTGHKKPTSLLAKASECAALFPENTHSAFKSSEYSTISEILTRVAMTSQPQHFESIMQSPTLSAEEDNDIFSRFFGEFAKKGAMDKWVEMLKENIGNSSSTGLNQDVAMEFLETASNFLKLIGSGKDPLNKYVDLVDIDKVISLRKWLEKNPTHLDYDIKQREFSVLDESIRSAREKALKEGADYMSSLTQRMNPEHPNDVTEDHSTKAKTHKQVALEKYVSEMKEKSFDHDVLRSFWEKVYRCEYGSTFYRMVSESFNPEFKDAPTHQFLQQIWIISQLDTINAEPYEARSRMPGKSIDGLKGPNFGYVMQESSAYANWIKNPLVIANGDIIVDAFHFITECGRELDSDDFIEYFRYYLNQHLSDEIYDLDNQYHKLMIPFQRFLLEVVYKTPFISDDIKTIPGELIRVSGSLEDLISRAIEVLNEFITFSHQMHQLRPTESREELSSKKAHGLVFGIGFNGKQFDSPDFANTEKGEIYITFSQSGRETEGRLFLEFTKYFASTRGYYLSNSDNMIDNYKYTQYKSIIKWHVKEQIKLHYEVPDSYWSSALLRWNKAARTKYEDFMSQLELEIAYDNLNEGFKTWIQKTSNWYYASSEIKVVDNISAEDKEMYEFARDLLFDRLTQRRLAEDHQDLIPLLFSFWKQKLLFLFAENLDIQSAISSTESFEDIPEEYKATIIGQLDEVACNIHPDIKSVWVESINAYFEKFIKHHNKPLKDYIAKIDKDIQKIAKALENPSLPDATRQKLVGELAAKQHSRADIESSITSSPSTMNLEKYVEFREGFFIDNDVSKCIEPLFARVLGHDHFFSVFISPTEATSSLLKLGNTLTQDVIAPCDKRCQYNVLGHVYTGDMHSHQSADSLHKMRHVHDLGKVPDMFMPLSDIFDLFSNAEQEGKAEDISTSGNSMQNSSCNILYEEEST